MWLKKINFLNIVKHDVAKTKIKKILGEKSLTEDAIQFVNRTIYCDNGRVSYKVILKNESFTIFDDGTQLKHCVNG
jgi:hypothetical protein